MKNLDTGAVSLKLLVLRTCQIDRLLAFYQSLGMKFTQEQHGKGPVHYATQLARVVLEIYPLADDASTADQTTRLGFMVGNLEQATKNLQANGMSGRG
jgi:lactoylglutathione lyase